MKHLYQKIRSKEGASNVSVVIMILIVVILVFGGWYYWYAQDNDLNDAMEDVENDVQDVSDEIGENVDQAIDDIDRSIDDEGIIDDMFDQDPDDFVNDFYDEWTSEIMPLNQKFNNAENVYLSSDFIEKAGNTSEQPDQVGYDPVTCSIYSPDEYRTINVNQDEADDSAEVFVEMEYPQGLTKNVRLELIRLEDQWIINNIECPDENTEDVSVYLYNQIEDEEINGFAACSSDAVLPVKREVIITDNPIIDTIGLLLSGEISEEETAEGYSTEFPGDNFVLIDSELEEGVLTLEFEDPNFFTSGGSCKASILKNQIEKTALQFEEVDEVVFRPDTLFQP